MTSACQSSQSSKSGSSETYTEDLSIVRAEYVMPEDTVTTVSEETVTATNVEPSNDVTMRLNSVLDKSDELRQDINTVDGFTIQVYSGTNSEEARKIRGKVLSILPDENAQLNYDEPNFKVKVGRYFSRIEAQQNFSLIQKEFPTSIIIPERIPIKTNASQD